MDKLHDLPELIRLLFEEPLLSLVKVGVRVGRSPQTVRRYRLMLERDAWTQEKLHGLDGAALDRMLNKPRHYPRKRPIDVQQLRRNPSRTVRAAWLAYRDEDPASAMSETYFARKHAAERRAERQAKAEAAWERLGRAGAVEPVAVAEAVVLDDD